MSDCVFCKIVAGEIPAYKVYEDESVLAFLDIMPVSEGHILVIPKKHYANFEEIPEEELFAVMKVVKKVGKSLKDNFKVTGYNVQENNDLVAGQEVPHIHFHIIPRKENDGFKLWSQGKYKEGEAEKIIEKIKINKLD